jgi:hypothetical protein
MWQWQCECIPQQVLSEKRAVEAKHFLGRAVQRATAQIPRNAFYHIFCIHRLEPSATREREGGRKRSQEDLSYFASGLMHSKTSSVFCTAFQFFQTHFIPMQMFLCKPSVEFFVRHLKILEALFLIPNSPLGFLELLAQ